MTLPPELRTAIHVISDGAMGGSPTPTSEHLHQGRLMQAWGAAIPPDLEARHEAQARQLVARQRAASKPPPPPTEPEPPGLLRGLVERLGRLLSAGGWQVTDRHGHKPIRA